MKKYDYIASAKRTLKIESDSVSAIGKQLNSSFTNLCEKVMASKGKFVIMGVGKSGHIAQKISATLSSTGTPSIFIHPTEAAHGDMGLINKKDVVLLISNSGETKTYIDGTLVETGQLNLSETNSDRPLNIGYNKVNVWASSSDKNDEDKDILEDEYFIKKVDMIDMLMTYRLKF